MRIISADYIFPVASSPVKNGLIVIDDDGTIKDVLEPTASIEKSNIETHKGLIVPGFVNAHCHLELSHLKGKLKEKTKLTGFVSEILSKRNHFSIDDIKSALKAAEQEMIGNGIVAVGDISNTNHTFEQKQRKNLSYHTFIEVFDINPKNAQPFFDSAASLQSEFPDLKTTLVPHAPYTVSNSLMELLSRKKQDVISIHNQETASENEMFISNTGELANLMIKSGADIRDMKSGGNSLASTFNRLKGFDRIILVHNTYTTKADVDFIKSQFTDLIPNVFFCFCPNANLFIEDRLPDILLFVREGMKVCIGTDSYASNWSLSILDEMKTIAKQFPSISFDTLITWATLNGAEALGFGTQLGSIEKGKKPGLNLLTGIEHEKMLFSNEVHITKLA